MMFLGNFPKSPEQLFSIFQNSRNAGTFLGPSQASLNGLFAKIADLWHWSLSIASGGTERDQWYEMC